MAANPRIPNAATLRIIWVIHFAFIAAVPIYMAMAATVLKPQANPIASSLSPSVVFSLFLLLSATSAMAGFFLVNFLTNLSQAKRRRPGPGPGSLTMLQQRVVITNSMFEAIAVYGLVGRVVGFTLAQSMLFMVVSLALLAFQTSRLAGWIADERMRQDRGE